MSDPRLETALRQLSEAARRIGEWRLTPAALTPSGRRRQERALANAEAAEANARQAIRRLFRNRVELREVASEKLARFGL